MGEPQKQLGQWPEGRPRKVRFRVSSACSGRLLKQVFEDGQQLEAPARERSRRFLRHTFQPTQPLCAPGQPPESSRLCSPAQLTAHSISIFRQDKQSSLSGSSPLLSDCQASDSHCRASPILDFGKIIIYTNNLKIIRAPLDQRELLRRVMQTEGDGDAEHGCSQCKGSGSAPCSLCHGSKLSMLANRFWESYRALRCPACNERGLQPCSCSPA